MSYLGLIFFIAVAVFVGWGGVSVVRGAVRETFVATLIEKYQTDEHATRGVNLKMRWIGWILEGSTAIRTSGMSKIGVDNESLFIVQLPVIARAFPTIEIPLDCLSLTSSRYFWSAFSRFDVFEIEGISSGQILLPVGFIASSTKSKC